MRRADASSFCVEDVLDELGNILARASLKKLAHLVPAYRSEGIYEYTRDIFREVLDSVYINPYLTSIYELFVPSR